MKALNLLYKGHHTGRDSKNRLTVLYVEVLNGRKEHTKASKLGEGGIIGIATYIAQLISPIVGIAIPILTPPIILVLHVAAKAGVKAYCANKNYNPIVVVDANNDNNG